LVRLIRGTKASVNLIPYNPVSGLGYQAPSRERCEAFRDALVERSVACTLRKDRGQDIDAACGQLRRRSETAAA
jgi:23S rRNA (adenine2503-C2)-methyltransferase